MGLPSNIGLRFLGGAGTVTGSKYLVKFGAVEMTEWLKDSNIAPKKVFVTHGEQEAASALGAHLAKEFGWSYEIPKLDYETSL